jgi:hypothetical protein
LATQMTGRNRTEMDSPGEEMAERIVAARRYADFPILLVCAALFASAGFALAYDPMGSWLGALFGLLIGAWLNSALARAVRALADSIVLQAGELADLRELVGSAQSLR